MKKIMTLMLVLLGVTSTSIAQTFEFRYGGESLENGATVIIDAQADGFFPDQKNCMTNPPSNPTGGLVLAILDGSQKSGKATLEITSNTLSPTLIQWCMGGVCELMTDKSVLEKTFTTGDDGVVKVEFDANDVASEGSLEAKLDVEIEGEKKSVMIKFVPEGATALSATKASHNNGKRYTIQGMPLEEGKSGKGIYIQEGKKFLRK